MTIQQLSIFVENKAGALVKVLDLFKSSGIQLIATTLADTVEYGIYRVICSEPERAYRELKAAGISVALTEVFALTLDHQAGRAADAIHVLTDAHIGISYMYSFLLAGKGILILRTDNEELTRATILQQGLSYVEEKDLSGLGIA